MVHDDDSDDLFDDIDDLLDQVEEEIQELMTSFKKNSSALFRRPFIKGFSLEFDEGKPVFRTFGDLDVRRMDREPLVEQSLKGDNLNIIVELPGVEKENIQLQLTERELALEAKSEDRVYKTQVQLREAVEPESAKATYRNGILEVRMKLRGNDNKGYKQITVE
jgi:HSP20 family protein